MKGHGHYHVDVPVPGAHVTGQLRAEDRCDGTQVPVLEGVDRVPHRAFELEDRRDARERGRQLGALAASTAIFELNAARTARFPAYPCCFAKTPVAEQLPFDFAVDAGLREDQVDGLPECEIQCRCQLQLSTLAVGR